jgi:peptidyl-tRNA hydrolase, PTH1 family
MAKQKEGLNHILIVGLGNPGADYYHTRHSLGFRVADAFAVKHSFPAFTMVGDNSMATEGMFAGKAVVLAKPQTFMNKSGLAVKRLAKHYSLFKNRSHANLWVVNDDLDIPEGALKISKNHGAAGHKGVQSIIDQAKTKNFVRWRIGIAPQDAAAKKIPGDKLVLKKMTPAEQENFARVIELAVAGLETALAEGVEKAMTEFNRAVTPKP